MNRDELIRRLTATFLEELAEHVRVFNAELLLLEQGPPPERRMEAIHALFRAAHSLKGAARAVSATAIEGVAHKVEDLLARIRDGRRELSLDLFQILFASADGFESAGRQFAAGSNEPSGLSGLMRSLDVVLAQPDSPPPVAAPEPVQALPAPATPSPPPTKAPAPSLPPPSSEPFADVVPSPTVPAAQAFVRIGQARLDTLLRQGSELTTTRRRLDARRDDLSSIQELLGRLRAEWQASGQALRRHKKRGQRVALEPGAELPKRLEKLFEYTDAELSRFGREVDDFAAALREDSKALDRAAAPLEAQIHELRLLPFQQACDGLSRVVRDLSVLQQKQVDLRVEGGNIQVDRAIVEGLREPLLHLVRNAIDHGIESPEARRAAGKSPRAELLVSAVAAGDSVAVTVADDGRGLNVEAIRQRALSMGLDVSNLGFAPERAIFLPGFSTAKAVTDVSGRGVGLDVVRDVVERMNGNVTVGTGGPGTRFTLTVPLTLSTMRALFVRVGGETMALPSAAVDVLVRVRSSDLRYVGDKVVVGYRGAPIPAASLAGLLGLPAPDREGDAVLPCVVLRAEGRRAALIVDDFQAEQDVVLKPLGPRVQGLPFVSGGTLLPTGNVAVVLKPFALLAAALDQASFAPVGVARPQTARRHLLLADDSLTTRTLERSILEAAGYDVTVAVDGQNAWQLLQERGADLLLSDVEMPRMDGLALTRNVRSSPRFRDLPVILLTSRDSAEDRARGLDAGANAYLVKSAFDQTNLLQAIERLL